MPEGTRYDTYDTYFQELRAELARYPSKERIKLDRRLLNGLRTEMEWAGRQIIRLEQERGDVRPGLERALEVLTPIDDYVCCYSVLTPIEDELSRLTEDSATDRAVARTRTEQKGDEPCQ